MRSQLESLRAKKINQKLKSKITRTVAVVEANSKIMNLNVAMYPLRTKEVRKNLKRLLLQEVKVKPRKTNGRMT